jgi:hypothetical protein
MNGIVPNTGGGLATEPRWPRSDGTFGSDPDRFGPLAAAVWPAVHPAIASFG